MADLEGFEPPHTWTKTRCLTAWLQVKNGEMRRNWTADTVSFNHMLYLLSYHPLNGRRGRTWTYDPCAPNAVLCQTELLSANGALGRIRTSEPEGDGLQPPVFNQTSLPTHFFFLVRLEGLEPSTFWVVIKCSIQLSYNPIGCRDGIWTRDFLVMSQANYRCSTLR